MRLGLVTYNIAKDWDLETLIWVCEEVGFDGLELRTSHRHGVEPLLNPRGRERVRKRFEQTQVRLVGLGTTCEFHSPDPQKVRQNIKVAREFILLAHDIGALGVKVRPNALPEGIPKEKTIRQIGEALKELGEFATDYGIEVWLEVHGQGTSDLSVIRAIMETSDHPRVGVCWNSNKTDVVNGTIRPNFHRVRRWLRHVHINELWRDDYPWKELFRLLKETGYDRFTMAEIPESPDAVRLLRYYRALWHALQPKDIPDR